MEKRDAQFISCRFSRCATSICSVCWKQLIIVLTYSTLSKSFEARKHTQWQQQRVTTSLKDSSIRSHSFSTISTKNIWLNVLLQKLIAQKSRFLSLCVCVLAIVWCVCVKCTRTWAERNVRCLVIVAHQHGEFGGGWSCEDKFRHPTKTLKPINLTSMIRLFSWKVSTNYVRSRHKPKKRLEFLFLFREEEREKNFSSCCYFWQKSYF